MGPLLSPAIDRMRNVAVRELIDRYAQVLVRCVHKSGSFGGDIKHVVTVGTFGDSLSLGWR
jgi:hypothetical protein